MKKVEKMTVEELALLVTKLIQRVDEMAESVKEMDTRLSRVDEDKVSELESKLDDLESLVEENDIDDLTSKVNDLESAVENIRNC